MPQLHLRPFAQYTAGTIALVLAISTVSLIASAQEDSTTPRPEFDESFLHWPVKTKINGRVIINREMTNFKPVERFLQRLTKGKIVVSFSSDNDRLAAKLKSLSDDDKHTFQKSDTTHLQSALNDADTIYLSSESFATPDLIAARDLFNKFIERGGSLFVDASIADVLGAKTADDSQGLNILFDCKVECSFDGTEASKQKLAQDIAQDIAVTTATVGVGIAPKTMTVLSGRRLFSFGSGSTTLAIAANESQPAKFQKISPQRSRNAATTADLTQWRRMAIDRTLPPFPSEKPKSPLVENGSLYIVGGGGMPRGLMRQMVKEAGGIANAKCVYIPCSESDSAGESHAMVNLWKRMGVKNATFIHAKDRNQANSDEAFLEPLKDATLLWFGGGRQWNFADSYYGTKAHKLMKEVVHRGGVIGGSSAGASIQGRFLARATPIGNSNILAPGYERGGLGFLSGVAIDQHFSQRGRQKDMTILVNKYPQLLGIGIDESTAIIVRKSRAEVVGPGKVFFYDRNEPVKEGKPDFTALSSGGVFDLANRKVIQLSDSKEEN